MAFLRALRRAAPAAPERSPAAPPPATARTPRTAEDDGGRFHSFAGLPVEPVATPREQVEGRAPDGTPLAGGGVLQREILLQGRSGLRQLTTAREAAAEIVGRARSLQNILPAFEDFPFLEDRFTADAVERIILARGYLTDGDQHLVPALAEFLFEEMLTDTLRERSGGATPVVDGIRLAVAGASASTEGLRRVPRGFVSKLDLHGQAITLRAVLGVQVPDTPEAGDWAVGFTQTALRVERFFKLRLGEEEPGGWLESTTELPAPANDRNENVPAPWYSGTAFQPLKAGFQQARVRMLDKPGEEFGSSAGLRSKRREGGDRFKTWLVLHNAKTGETVFLKEWSWGVDYGVPEGVRTWIEDAAGTDVAGPPGDAVLGGPRTKDRLINDSSQRERDSSRLRRFRAAVGELQEAIDRREADAEVIRLQNRMQDAYAGLPPDEQDEEAATRRHIVNRFFAIVDPGARRR